MILDPLKDNKVAALAAAGSAPNEILPCDAQGPPPCRACRAAIGLTWDRVPALSGFRTESNSGIPPAGMLHLVDSPLMGVEKYGERPYRVLCMQTKLAAQTDGGHMEHTRLGPCEGPRGLPETDATHEATLALR